MSVVFRVGDNNGQGVRLSVTGTTGRVDLGTDGGLVRVCNLSAVDCYVALGGSTVEADDECFYIPGNDVLAVNYLTRDSYLQDHLAAICDTGEVTTLQITAGEWEAHNIKGKNE